MVAAVDLDYVTGKRFSRVGMAILASGILFLVSVAWYYHALGLKISDAEMLVSRLKEAEKNTHLSPVTETRDAKQIVGETKQANAVILALSLPWKEFFEAFEVSQINDVAVLAIEPDVMKGVVHISAEAKKLESMLDYVSSLQKIALFREVLILNHQIQEQDPQKPIRFVLQASWEIQH